MNPTELEKTGKILFGEYWKAKLANCLGVSPRMVSYWLVGTHKMRKANSRLLQILLKEKETK